MQRIVRLPLYGDIEHSSPDFDLAWDLFQTEALTRLRDISLSSTPSRFAAHGMAASRFEHSVGVAYLARCLCSRKGHIRDEKAVLMTAALCHDIGSPPFSHISEIFFHDLTGRTHEEETEEMLAEGGELFQLLSSYRIDPARVISIIQGKDAQLGPLIAGSIDLDNIDNSIHLMHSIGYRSDRYKPVELINAYRWNQGQLYLDTAYLADIVGWADTRKELYSILHSEVHLSSAAMLYRALEFAYAKNELDADFFRLGESDALFFLAERCNRQTRELMQRTLRWKQYHLFHQRLLSVSDPRLTATYNNWQAKKDFSDNLAKLLGIDPVDIAVYIGADRGEKKISLPFVGEHAEAVASLFSNRAGAQRVSIFMPKKFYRLKDSKKLTQAIDACIEQLPEPAAESDSGHTFF